MGSIPSGITEKEVKKGIVTMCNECHDLHFYRQESHFPDSTIYRSDV